MKKAPYSISEAKEICREYQYLVGQAFAADSTATVSYVTIAPFDQANRSRFIMFYLLLNDFDIALNYEYKGMLFDVLVVSGSSADLQLQHEDIHSWLAKNKFNTHIEEGVTEYSSSMS